MKFGFIICEAELVDCIYIDKDYQELIKNENLDNYLCGDFTEGRYAWVLKNVKELNEPIEIGGQLGLWNFGEEESNES